MKKNVLKKMLAFTLTAVMAVSMMACGGGDKDAKTTDNKDNGAANTSSADNSDKPDTWIADRTITVQAYVDDIGYSLPKDWDNSPVAKKIKELTGISLKIQYTPGDSDSKILASQLAAGTIPDVIVSYLNNSTRKEFPLLLKAAKEGMFADLSEYLKNSKVYSKYAEDGYLPRDSYENIVFREDFDGAVYLLHSQIDEVDNSTNWIPETEYLGGMYIQKSIADALNIDPKAINTQDQLYDLLVQIKEGGFKDDNGNPVYPLGPKFWGGSVDSLDWITKEYNWGVSGDYNIDEDGNVKHEAETDWVYKKVNYIRKLIAEGLMNPEFFTMDSTRAEEASKTHNSAIIADVHNYQDIIYQSDEWVPLGPLNDIQGDHKVVTHGKTGNGCWAISADAKNPEEIFRFFDWLSTDEGQLIAQYGVEGESFDMVDGKPVLKEEVAEKLNSGDTDWLVNNVGACFGNQAVVFWGFMTTNLNPIENFGESRPGASSSSTYTRSIELATEYAREKKLIPGLDATAFMSADEMADVKAQMDLLNYDEVLVQACFADSEADVESIIESFRAQLKSSGNEKFEEYVKELYTQDPEMINFYK